MEWCPWVSRSGTASVMALPADPEVGVIAHSDCQLGACSCACITGPNPVYLTLTRFNFCSSQLGVSVLLVLGIMASLAQSSLCSRLFYGGIDTIVTKLTSETSKLSYRLGLIAC